MPQQLEGVKPGKGRGGRKKKGKIELSNQPQPQSEAKAKPESEVQHRKSVGWDLWEEAVKRASCPAVALSYLWEAVSVGRAVLKKGGKSDGR